MGIGLLKLFTIVNHTQQTISTSTLAMTPMSVTAGYIFDRNYATGLLTKQQHAGSL